jgi:site-specific DNA recombinase
MQEKMNKPMTVPQKDSGTSTRRVALYCRVSTSEQAEQGVSIDTQLKALRSWSDLQKWHMAGEYVDEGYSGTTDNRPSFQRLMLDAKLG